MKVKLVHIVFILLLPAYGEAFNISSLLISIPGFPLSLGRTSLVLAGFLGFTRVGITIHYRNFFVLGSILILLGLLMGSYLSKYESTTNIRKVLGIVLLTISTFGLIRFWKEELIRKSLDFFFVALFVFWVFRILFSTVFNFAFLDYSTMYQKGIVVNHHIPGMILSVAGSYLSVRYFFREGMLMVQGFIVFFISFFVCIIIGSRSNLIITFGVMLFLISKGKVNLKQLISTTFLMIVGFLLISNFILKDEYLTRRFTSSDLDYQERSTSMRIDFIEIGAKELLINPFGKGLADSQIDYKGRTTMMHNQYFSWALGGGIIAVFGVFVLFFGIIKLFRTFNKSFKLIFTKGNAAIGGLNLVAITFFLTLFTIESSGILYFIILSFAVFVLKQDQLLSNPHNLNNKY